MNVVLRDKIDAGGYTRTWWGIADRQGFQLMGERVHVHVRQNLVGEGGQQRHDSINNVLLVLGKSALETSQNRLAGEQQRKGEREWRTQRRPFYGLQGIV